MEKKRKPKKIELEEGIPAWKVQLLNELQEQIYEEHYDK